MLPDPDDDNDDYHQPVLSLNLLLRRHNLRFPLRFG